MVLSSPTDVRNEVKKVYLYSREKTKNVKKRPQFSTFADLVRIYI